MASYKSYELNSDIIAAFKSTPKQTGIAASLRFRYYLPSTPATKTTVTGTVVEDDGTYLSPAFQIATAGKYIVLIEYTTDGGTTWAKVGETEISVGETATSTDFTFSAVI